MQDPTEITVFIVVRDPVQCSEFCMFIWIRVIRDITHLTHIMCILSSKLTISKQGTWPPSILCCTTEGGLICSVLGGGALTRRPALSELQGLPVLGQGF